MASGLCSGRREGGGGDGGDRRRRRDADDDCPVCLNPLPRARRAAAGRRTEGARVVAFPCGHVICSTCDAEMERRNFHACPTCRTPRAGYSRSDVDLASQARVLVDQAADEGDGAAQFGQQQQPGAVFHAFVSRGPGAAHGRVEEEEEGGGGGRAWTVMFFRDQSHGHPFDPLLAAAAAAGDAAGDAAPSVRVFRQRHAAAAPRVSGVRGRRGSRSPPAEQEEEEGESNGGPLRPERPAAQVALDAELTDLIENYLLRPTSLPAFLARHASATGSMARGRASGAT